MTIAKRIDTLQQLIQQLETDCCRPSGSVELLAVSKGHSAQAIEQAFAAGLSSFGENYVQEALVKINALADRPLCWHFIGAIQSNKTHAIANHFSWVQSVCRTKIAQLLNDQRPASMPIMNVCIQVNIDDEKTKSGIRPEHVAALAADIMHMPRLKLRGFMVIPAMTLDEHQQYLTFLSTANLMDQINKQLGLNMDTLSMGMSADLPAAIRAGSTMIRVGRRIFGERASLS